MSDLYVCRGCMESVEYSQYNELNTNNRELFQMCTNLKITPNDDLPKFICDSCLQSCLQWQDFKNTCERSETKLKELIKVSRLEKIEFVNVENSVKEESDTEEGDTSQEFEGFNCSISSADPSEIKFEYEFVEKKIKTENFDLQSKRKNRLEIPSPTRSPIEFLIKENVEEETEGLELVEIDENIIKVEKNLGKRKSTKRKYAEESEEGEYEVESSSKCSWKCKSCKTNFNTVTKYEQHYLRVHSNRDLTPCRICSAKFTTYANLQHHLKTKHTVPVIQATVFCIDCNDGFETETDLKKHTLKFHRTFSCETCKKAFGKSSTLKKHIITHSEERPFVCTECPKAFKFHNDLAIHIKTHDDSQKKHMCPECGHRFLKNANLVKHMAIHTEVRPWSCSFCSKTFKGKHNLAAHIKIHTYFEKPHACDICERAFKDKKVMLKHRMIHTGEKPHVCKICERGFIQKSALKTHLKTHGLEFS